MEAVFQAYKQQIRNYESNEERKHKKAFATWHPN